MLRRPRSARSGPASISTLASVDRVGPIRLGELAEREGVTPPTLSRDRDGPGVRRATSSGRSTPTTGGRRSSSRRRGSPADRGRCASKRGAVLSPSAHPARRSSSEVARLEDGAPADRAAHGTTASGLDAHGAAREPPEGAEPVRVEQLRLVAAPAARSRTPPGPRWPANASGGRPGQARAPRSASRCRTSRVDVAPAAAPAAAQASTATWAVTSHEPSGTGGNLATVAVPGQRAPGVAPPGPVVQQVPVVDRHAPRHATGSRPRPPTPGPATGRPRRAHRAQRASSGHQRPSQAASRRPIGPPGGCSPVAVTSTWPEAVRRSPRRRRAGRRRATRSRPAGRRHPPAARRPTTPPRAATAAAGPARRRGRATARGSCRHQPQHLLEQLTATRADVHEVQPGRSAEGLVDRVEQPYEGAGEQRRGVHRRAEVRGRPRRLLEEAAGSVQRAGQRPAPRERLAGTGCRGHARDATRGRRRLAAPDVRYPVRTGTRCLLVRPRPGRRLHPTCRSRRRSGPAGSASASWAPAAPGRSLEPPSRAPGTGSSPRPGCPRPLGAGRAAAPRRCRSSRRRRCSRPPISCS